MRRLAFALCLAAALVAVPALARQQDDALQRAFVEAMQRMQAGNLARAERLLRDMRKRTDSPRVKLELARVLFLQAKYDEAKALFEEVMTRSDTPWRVRDNIANFVRLIEERTGYLKFGASIVSDSNPRNLTERKEIALGNLRVTPTEAPRKVTGLRLSARGWLPAANGFRTAGYLTASYTDYPGQDLDRLTADFGALRDLTGSGRTRVKAGLEFGTYGGELLYRFPYVGLDSVLRETKQYRIAGELKAGRIQFPDFRYLDATYLSAAASARKPWSQNTVVSLSTMLERSQAKERPYSYTGWNLGPAIDAFWPETTFLAGARLSLGARRYAAADPLFGKRRSDSKLRLDVSVGNKRWRWRDRYVSLVASVERSHSNIEYYSYRKFNVSLVVE